MGLFEQHWNNCTPYQAELYILHVSQIRLSRAHSFVNSASISFTSHVVRLVAISRTLVIMPPPSYKLFHTSETGQTLTDSNTGKNRSKIPLDAICIANANLNVILLFYSSTRIDRTAFPKCTTNRIIIKKRGFGRILLTPKRRLTHFTNFMHRIDYSTIKLPLP